MVSDSALVSAPSEAKSEIYSTLKPFLKQHPEYEKAWEILQNPERIIQFK